MNLLLIQGDVIYIPADVPHKMIVDRGKQPNTVAIKVKEK
jgi:uncharacterized RmlC-like cupin family protein